MKYPIACMIITPVLDPDGEIMIEKGKRKEVQVPGYILSKSTKFNTDGTIWIAYEVVDMTGSIMWLEPLDVMYEIQDIHERFRRVKNERT